MDQHIPGSFQSAYSRALAVVLVGENEWDSREWMKNEIREAKLTMSCSPSEDRPGRDRLLCMKLISDLRAMGMPEEMRESALEHWQEIWGISNEIAQAAVREIAGYEAS